MSDDKTYLKIEIPEEEETVLQPEQPQPSASDKIKDSAKTTAKNTGKVVATTAVTAWKSDTRKKITAPVRRGITAVTVKTGRAIQDQISKVVEKKLQEEREAMQTRIKETDWAAEAKKGTAKGINWLSEKSNNLSNRVAPENKDTTTEDQVTRSED